jgi:glycogen debranching enzyme
VKNKIEKIKSQLGKEIESLKDKKGYLRAGKPKFNRLFGRDSLIAAWQLLDIDPKITENTLKILATFQGKEVNNKKEEEPGKILHETDFKHKFHPQVPELPFPYYGSVDSTPLFLILFAFFYQKTKDKKFLKRYFANILSAVNWLINYGDKDNDLFLEYERKNPYGLYHQGWKDGLEESPKIKPPIAVVEVQGYQYLALKEMVQISKILEDKKLSDSLLKRTRALKEKFNEKFWMPKQKYFALALNGEKNQKKTITSNPGHLLFTEIIDFKKVDFVVKRLFQEDLWTPFGIRTHSKKESDFSSSSYHQGSVWPHDNWIIAQGLKKLGFKKEYLRIKKALLRAYQKLGFIPELYGVKNKKIFEIPQACYPQAWASGALLNFLTIN